MNLGETTHLWLLLCAALVLLMQPGFLLLETGLVRTKNSIHVALKNLLDFCLAGLLFWAVGFGVMFGDSHAGWFGTSELLFTSGTSASKDVLFVYQLMFCGAAVTIISGAVAERTRLVGYLLIAAVTALFIYPWFGHWVWGGLLGGRSGWLAELGFVDFAGATVVHGVGGWMALAAVIVVGPRSGFHDRRATMPAQNLSTSAAGVLLLAIGWLGFNGGSAAIFDADTPAIVINTVLGGMAGGAVAFLWTQLLGSQRVEPTLFGVVAGLVGVTAGAHAISPAAAIALGGTAAIVAVAGQRLLFKLRVDDVVGAVAVHAFAGAWGTIVMVLFADPTKLATGLSLADQLVVQTLGVIVCAALAFLGGLLALRVLDRFVPLRCDPLAETLGLNAAEHGATNATQELLSQMESQRQAADFTQEATVEPHTEVGQIAEQYNRVLRRVREEHARAGELAERAVAAQTEAEAARYAAEQRERELHDFNRVAVDREHRMIDLKRQINALLATAGKPPRFDLEMLEGSPASDPA